MTFLDIEFLIFLLATTIIFYICPVRHRWKILLASSIVFYCIASVKYLPFILVTSFTIFLAGRKMGKIYESTEEEIAARGLERKEQRNVRKIAKEKCKKVMLLALILNIGILVVIKFTKFAVNPINTLLTAIGTNHMFDASFIIVPLGISYYTFSCVSYLLDVYWKRVDYEKEYARFLLYAIYFPHILQGPIERYGKLGQRLKGEFLFDYDRVCKGIQLMVWGFFKKLVIADRINMYTSGVYAEGSQASGVIYILAFFADIVYIYSDFSGCMDIARGASQIFGVELDLNFNRPFMSKSIVEFWRRWHMSLGGWFKDYVYYPISTSDFVKNVSKKCRNKLPDAVTRSIVTAIPVTVTWVLTGLWHGTGKTYLAWGVYYAFMIFVSVSFEDVFQKWSEKLHINTTTWSWRLFQMVRTTIIFGVGRLLTRPNSLRLSAHAFKSALTTYNPEVLFDGSVYTYGLDEKNFRIIILAVFTLIVVSVLQERGVKIRDTIARQNLVFRWMFYLIAVFSVLILGVYGPGFDAASFVYMAY